jgi:anti-anti-sigma factor
MAVKIEQQDGSVVVHAEGELSWEARESLAESVADALPDTGPVAVIVDFKDVTAVNSAGIGGLMQLVKAVRQHDGVLRLANVRPTFERLFETVGLTRLAAIDPDLAAARAAVKASADEDSGGPATD